MKKTLGFLVIVVVLILALISWNIHLQCRRLENILENLQRSEQRVYQIDQTLDHLKQQLEKK